jgi:cold shock CspA family protein
MSSIDWNPLNLTVWQIGLAGAGGAVVFVFIVVLVVLATQGVFSAAGPAELAKAGGYSLNDSFAITAITNTATGSSFSARWIRAYERVDLSNLPGTAATDDTILAAWKGSGEVWNNNEYVTLIENKDGDVKLHFTAIQPSDLDSGIQAGDLVHFAKTAKLTPSVVTGALPQDTSAAWVSTTTGTLTDPLVITFA